MTTVLRASELEAIKRRAFIGKLVVNDETQALNAEAQRRARLKASSEARSKRWPNTLEAQRRQKANARKAREEKEEAARRVLDQEEEQRRARNRLATIKRANDKLQAQTDRMKMLQSQKLLSEVIDVRKKQVTLKTRIKDMEVSREKQWFELQQEQLREAEAKEIRKAAKEKKKALTLAAEQKEQLELYTQEYIKRLTEERLEGELVRKKALEDIAKDKKAEEAKRRQARQNNLDMKRANEALDRLKEKEREKEREEERKLQKYAREKEEEKQRRIDFVERKRADAEDQAQRMRDIMEADYLARQSNEDKRLMNQAAEARAKEDAAVARKEERRRKQEIAIHRSRQQQLERKRREAERIKARDAAVSSAWKQVHVTIEKEERAEAAARRLADKEHQAYLLRQMAEREGKIERARKQERDAANAAIYAARADDDAFRVTVKNFIAEESYKGHNAKGVARSLHKVQEEQLQAATAFY